MLFLASNSFANTVRVSAAGSVSVVLTLRNPPVVVFQLANFSATASGGMAPYSFSWSFGDGTPNVGGGIYNPNLYNYTYSVKGSYTVKVNATDFTGTIGTASLTITVKPNLKLTVTAPSVTFGTPATLTASATGGTAPYKFSWSFGDGTPNATGTSNPNVQSHNYTAANAYTFKVSVVDGNGNKTSVSSTVKVLPLSILGFDCAYGSSTEGSAFPTSITTSAPYSTPDFDGTLDSNCQATYLADTDLALHPLVSDNPTAVVNPGAGGGLTVDVVAYLNQITTINGFDISVKYNTTVLNAVVIDQSGLIWGNPSPPPGIVILTLAKGIDPVHGIVRLAQVIIGSQQGPGAVELFRVRFDILGASAVTAVTLRNDILTNPSVVPKMEQNLSVNTTGIYNVLNSARLNLVANWTFTPSPEVVGSPLTFTALASCLGCAGTLRYFWDFSSSDSPTYVRKVDKTGSSVTITAPAPVVNRVTLTVNDSAVPAHTMSITRLLPLALVVTPGITSLTSGTAGGSWTAQWLGGVTTATSGYTGSWTFCPGTATNHLVCSAPTVSFSQSGTGITQTTSPTAVTYNFAGLYSGTVRVADTPELQTGTSPTGNTASVTFLNNVTGTTAAYTVSVGANSTFPVTGKSISFTANVTYASSYPTAFRSTSFNFLFDFGDGTSPVSISGQNTISIVHTYSSHSKFLVKVVVQETSTVAKTKIQENGFLNVVSVTSLLCGVVSNCDFGLNPASPVPGGSVTFTATNGGGDSPYAFSWTFGDGSTGSGQTVTHTYQSAGTYNVTLTITDSNGQTFTVKKTVSVSTASSNPFGFLTSPGGIAAIAGAVVLVAAVLLYAARRRRSVGQKAPSPYLTSSGNLPARASSPT